MPMCFYGREVGKITWLWQSLLIAIVIRLVLDGSIQSVVWA
jgi:hypothetical protein